MSKLRMCAVLFVAVLLAVAATALRAQEPPAISQSPASWSLQLEAAYQSKYVWRGIERVNGAVFQPSATLGYGNLSGTVWANIDLSDVNDNAGEFSEVDLTLDYAWSWESLRFNVGAVCYTFPETSADSTSELYAGVGADILLRPTLTLYQDVDQVHGTYASFSLAHAFSNIWEPLPGLRASAEVTASVGYASAEHNAYYYGVDSAALTDCLVTAALPIRSEDGWAVIPSASCSALLDSAIRDSMSSDKNFWIGLALTGSF